MNTRVLDGAAVRETATRALAILDRGDALVRPTQLSLGPRLSPDLDAVLAELGPSPPTIVVRCENYEGCDAKRLDKWAYDPQWRSVVPVHGTTAAWTHGAPAWLDRANAGKGAVQTAGGPGAKHDGLGTHNYSCPGCHRHVSVSTERRLRLYLTALARGRHETLI